MSHQLDSLTDRNQHKDFENFARKVCEREICPNLRPQTGPEGGGDGKVDTETYPVDSKISERWYVGDSNSRQEKWAFAFSAKKAWSEKVRSDVNGIVETNRGYEKILFVTNRPTRARDRLRIEDELKTEHGISVTILDREWLIDRVFEHNHKDLAFEHLHAGTHDPASVKLGPRDFECQQALDEIEDRLSKLGDKVSDRTQAVSDTFEAASLSRRLEKPRYETEGRFLRAINYAKKYGADYQLLRATYELAWTRFWWLDDVDGMQELYEEVEQIAFDTDHAHHISKVCNLHQLIVGRVANGLESSSDLSLEMRTARLKTKLVGLAADKSRPNNALHAETLLLFHTLNEKALAGESDLFDETWLGLSDIIDRAKGLGEFPADLLDTMIEALMPVAPESEVFDSLLEKLAEFLSERNKERTAGELYLRQGERKLDAEKPIDAIKFLGRAVVNFMKDESKQEQAQALYCLAVGYRGAGLLWAARGAALAAVGQASTISEQDGEFCIEIVPTYSLFTLLSLQLGHITDFIDGIQHLRKLSEFLPLADESRSRLEGKLVEYDQLFACLLIDLPKEQIRRLTRLPDVLEQSLLFVARTALLYRLGHIDVLRDDGSIPEGMDDVEIHHMMEMMASQPAGRDLPKELVLLDDEFGSVSTTIMGVSIQIKVPSNEDGFLLAEAHVSFLEALISTLLNSGAYPHRERLEVHVRQDDKATEASAEVIADGSTLSVTIPTTWNTKNFDQHAQFVQHLVKFGSIALAHTVMLRDYSKTLEQLIGIERAVDRASLFCRIGIFRNRFLGGYVGKLSDWDYCIERPYNLNNDAPVVTPKTLPEEDEDERSSVAKAFDELNSHRDLSVSSLTSQTLWDAANWQGMLYGNAGPGHPPILGLIFSSAQNARAIFREWKERFGERDTKDEIRISVVKGIDRDNPFHYRGCLSRETDALSKDERTQLVIVSQKTTMTVNDHDNLQMFLRGLHAIGCYWLAPAVVGKDGQPELLLDHAILKRKFHVRDAWQIGLHDIDAVAISPDDDVIIPGGESNPPIRELLEWHRNNKTERKK